MTDPKVSADGVGTRVQASLATLLGEVSAASVFSAPVTSGNDLVITAAAWERGGGFGFGAGGGDSPEGSGSGGGGGAGGGLQGRPVAVIRVGKDGIEVKPILDYTKLGATILLSALGVWRALRR
ncbi:MAG TPA: spore germination protein GerW family protein [Acidimicrobiia bacterium]|nr:spore germination protein GerW family protein [Acidimicrobiia bacterium]